VIRLVDKMQKT